MTVYAIHSVIRKKRNICLLGSCTFFWRFDILYTMQLKTGALCTHTVSWRPTFCLSGVSAVS